MKPKFKGLLLSLCAVSLVAASVFGTMAYLTDDASVVNTFTVGSVQLTLDEADVKPDGTLDGTSRVQENEYHLLPGHSYIKDPTVHVTANSENCYVFVTVDNQIKDIEADSSATYSNIADQMEVNGWDALVNDTGATVLKDGKTVFVYNGEKANTDGIIEKSTTITDLTVFSNFKIDGDSVTSGKPENPVSGMKYLEDYATSKITINAYAAQADGFDTAFNAWDAAFGN